MSSFCCPVCKKSLYEENRTLRCENGHAYDLARQGYVNLLRSSRSASKRHGDDKCMIQARQRFLESGAYSCLADAVSDSAAARYGGRGLLLDVGCGECWYTVRVKQALEARGYSPAVCGVDISKEALICAARRKADIELAVASVSRLPVADGACGLVLNLFAPCAEAEFSRVLRADGVLIRAIPLERHLWGLKAAIYDFPYENKVASPELPGFQLVERQEIYRTLTLDTRDAIADLFRMTPYYYKTGASDQKKLEELTHLETELAFAVLTYRKNQSDK